MASRSQANRSSDGQTAGLRQQELQSLCELLEQLIAADRFNTLEHLQPRIRAVLLLCDDSIEEICDGPASNRAIYEKLLHLFVATCAQALHLVNKHCDAVGGPDMQPETAAAVNQLCLAASRVLTGTCCPEPAKRQLMAQQVAVTGLLPILAQGCSHITAAVHTWAQRQQQQQQQQLMPEHLAALAHALLTPWQCITRQWPGPVFHRLREQQLAVTHQPVIQLTAAVLSSAWSSSAATAAAAATNAPSSSSSSSRRGQQSNVMPSADACNRNLLMLRIVTMQAVQVAHYITDACAASMMSRPDGPPSDRLITMQPRDLPTSVIVQPLLLLLSVDIARASQQLHTLMKGRSGWRDDDAVTSSSSNSTGNASSSSGSSNARGSRNASSRMSRTPVKKQQSLRLKVPPYHERLLSALNMGCLDRLELPELHLESFKPLIAVQVLRVLMAQQIVLLQQQQSVQVAVPLTLLVPLLLCCIELALLAPGPGLGISVGFAKQETAYLSLKICTQTAAMLMEATLNTLNAAGSSARLNGMQQMAQKVSDDVTGPVLQLLGPVVRQQLLLTASKQQDTQPVGAAAAARDPTLPRWWSGLMLSLAHAAAVPGVNNEAYAPIFVQKPFMCAATLQAAARAMVTDLEVPPSHMQLMCTFTENGLRRAVIDGVQLIPAAATDTPPGSAKELAGLCVSLLKVAEHYAAQLWPAAADTAAAAAAPYARAHAQEAAVGAWTAVSWVVPAACTTAKHQKAHGQPVSPVWLGLLGRAVMVLATYLPTAAGLVQPSAAGARIADKHLVYATLEKAMSIVHWLAKELSDAQLPGGEAAAAAVAATAAAAGCSSVAELQQQLEAAWELAVRQLRGTSSYSNGRHVISTANAPVPASLAAAAGDLAKPLQAFGLAVAVHFPAGVLCCNPGCVNLQGSSEAQLLGPGSRCSRCRVARFCSKQCSVAAWKAGHKAACSRLKEAARAAA